MHFGMPTLLECPSMEESLSLCSELGLDFVELNMNLPEYQLDRLDRDSAKQLLKTYEKYPTIHLEENFNVCDFNASVAEAYLNTALGAISLAKELNAPIINMHMAKGVYFSLPQGRVHLFEQYQDQYLERLKRFRDICADEIDGSHILICVENTAAYQSFQQVGIDMLLESSCFALTYDIGHDYCTMNENEGFIMSRINKLKHFHFHDATRTRNHLTLGTGEIDLGEKLALVQKQGCRCVLETKTVEALRQSVEYLTKQKQACTVW